MGQAVVTFGSAVTKGEFGSAPVISAYPRSTEELSTSGSQVTTVNTAGLNDAAIIKNNSTTAIWAAVGVSPAAAVGSGHFILPGEAYSIGGLKDGHRLSLVDDS